MATCKDCDQDIIWSETGNTKKIALDAKPVKKTDPRFAGSNIWKAYVLLPGGELGLARRGTEEDRRLHRDLYTCHWDTCTERGK
jgi:hypothetical protein